MGVTRALAIALALLLGARAAQADEAAPPQPRQASTVKKETHRRREIHLSGRDLAALLWLPFAAFGGAGFKLDEPETKTAKKTKPVKKTMNVAKR